MATYTVLSDLHLEFDTSPRDYKHLVPCKQSDVVVLAGDVHTGSNASGFVTYLLDLGYIVVYVPGNHEYYHQDIKTVDDAWYSFQRQHSNFYYLNNNCVRLGDTTIIGSTLWASLDTLYVHPILGICRRDRDYAQVCRVTKEINDFSTIKGMSSDTMIEMFYDSVDYIFDTASKEEDNKVIVVTHHAPSFTSVMPRFKDMWSTHCFASHLDTHIEDSNISLWIHGHLHNQSDYYIGNTRIICNPRGYNDLGALNREFDPHMTITL